MTPSKMKTEEIDEKLALLVNGQLDKAESEALEREIAQAPELAQEADFLKALQVGMQSSEEPTPGAMGLARLQRDIRNQQTQTSRQEPQASKPSTGSFWKPLALAASVLLGVQTLVMGSWQMSSVEGVNVMPMSGSKLGEVGAQGARLQLVFNDAATAAQMASLLLAVNASIIDGPSALGIYTVVLPPKTDAELVVQQLDSSGVIEEVSVL